MTKDQNTLLGDMLRDWRRHRGLSQMALALDCGISARHLSFIETGRSRPSREVALRLSDGLNLSPHVRDGLLRAAGLAPDMPQPVLNLPAQTSTVAALRAIEALLAATAPFPALAIDRAWNLVARNDALSAVIQGVDAALLRPPVNVLRLCLHPRGLASRTVNLTEWRAHLLGRLTGQVAGDGDNELAAMLAEVCGYGGNNEGSGVASERVADETAGTALPLILRVEGEERTLRFLNATTVFGGPGVASIEPFAVISFLPMDPFTRGYITHLSSRPDAWPGPWSAPPEAYGQTAPWPEPHSI